MAEVILALDQGTTSSRAIVFDRTGRPMAQHNEELPQIFPRPGWVEHDPESIWETQISSARRAISAAGVSAADLVAIGLANQRETTVIWDRATGAPAYNAIAWQDRRTSRFCETLRSAGWSEIIREKTGLVIDPYFSATKLTWLLDNVDGLRRRAENGEVVFGTVDSYLIHRLTVGRLHVTDSSNASRTMLFNINTLDWDNDILHELRIPRAMLPEVRPSSGVLGMTDPSIFARPVPIAGIAGDQQAATFGQGCFETGQAKQTYGTGAFMLMNVGLAPKPSLHGLLSTIAWNIDGRVSYALEGAIFATGATVQWLRDGLGIIGDASETEALATSVDSTGGVYLVPAFAGLGAPYWDADARGTIVGLTRGSGRAEIVRAALESVAYQTRDILEAMQADSGVTVKELRVDGGMVANDFLMQFQADILDRPVERPRVSETTALGAAYLAGLAVGFWGDQQEIVRNWSLGRRFRPEMDASSRESLYQGWQRAVDRSRG